MKINKTHHSIKINRRSATWSTEYLLVKQKTRSNDSCHLKETNKINEMNYQIHTQWSTTLDKLNTKHKKYKQVTWLVVIEVRSKSFGLVTECRHYNGRAGYRPLLVKRTSHAAMSFHRWVWYHALSRASSSCCRLLLCQILFLLRPLFSCWASPGRKIAYWITESLSQSSSS